ncbi:hypothetical protein K2Z83_22235 [Oscillochloris sp. ZM17-4]|uniref:hypothetical protein n=1 Tax=Oscillochloris sp. ZM17-4 TaxID=2866714 RepID=UPI001C72D6A9|nr:hypothetical protein [Oscillochloris sp. ZM17-4]MBX0330383.1 hypothetical protein [Oscillochloris sp. ZM17-4]
MPSWQPNWQDVIWDHGAADAAVAALGRAASEIDRAAGERARAALTLLGEWRGAHRLSFDDQLRRADGEDQALAGDLRRAAQEVSRLSQQAREEQARRVYDRAEWRRECERERERQRERERRARENASVV